MLYTRLQAEEFFAALRLSSIELLKLFGLPQDQGRKRYSAWKEGHPIGVTEHYTAGVTWKGTVRWLNDGGHDNKVSCQMLILDRMLPEAEEIYKRYPPLKPLLVTTIMLSDGMIPCWHAGWVNRLSFGIENRNAGMLRGYTGGWTWWAKGWTARFPYEKLGKIPQNIDGLWWEPYTHGQVAANIYVCRMLHCWSEGGLDPRWFLPHSATTGSKCDTGRAFPLSGVRNAVFSHVPMEELYFLQKFKADPMYMTDYDEEEDAEFLHDLAVRQAEREGVSCSADLAVLEAPPTRSLQMLVEGGNWRRELGVIRRALHRLGYEVPADNEPELDPDTALAVYQFQKSMKMKTDRIPGRKTQWALGRRLKQFKLW